MNPQYRVDSVEVVGLWHYRDVKVVFYDDISILIGPNASGKTTILNLLRFVLTVDIQGLSEIEFNNITIVLKSFDGSATYAIDVAPTKRGYRFSLPNKKIELDLTPLPRRMLDSNRLVSKTGRRWLGFEYQELEKTLSDIVPAVWLPVSRRLPIVDAGDHVERMPFTELESVDSRLAAMLDELRLYHGRLSTRLSQLLQEFQKKVLEMILYSKEHDQASSLTPAANLTATDRAQLVKAFEQVGLLDAQMRHRIEEHFTEAEAATQRLQKQLEDGITRLDLNDVFIIPLIRRTKSIIDFARELDQNRNQLFATLRKYEQIVNSFLGEKSIKVDQDGSLIMVSLPTGQELGIAQLSSGEKQILILLTQALLWEGRPTVYVVDEPELSLHVTWQEKLLESLLELGSQMQIIAATHSPDIIGPFVDNVIDLGENRWSRQ